MAKLEAKPVSGVRSIIFGVLRMRIVQVIVGGAPTLRLGSKFHAYSSKRSEIKPFTAGMAARAGHVNALY